MNWIRPRISSSIRKTFTDACLHETVACSSHCEIVYQCSIRQPFLRLRLLSIFLVFLSNVLIHLPHIFLIHCKYSIYFDGLSCLHLFTYLIFLRSTGHLFRVASCHSLLIFEEAIEQMNDVQAIFMKKAMLRDWKEGSASPLHMALKNGTWIYIWMQKMHMGHANQLLLDAQNLFPLEVTEVQTDIQHQQAVKTINGPGSPAQVGLLGLLFCVRPD